MTLKESKVDKIWGVICIAFGLAMIFLITPAQTHISEGTPWYNSPAMLPNALSGVLIFCGICLLYQGFTKAKAGGKKDPDCTTFTKEGLMTLLGFFAIFVVYIILLNVIHHAYIPLTIVALAALMFFCGQKKILVLVGVSVILPIIIYYSFKYGLNIRFM